MDLNHLIEPSVDDSPGRLLQLMPAPVADAAQLWRGAAAVGLACKRLGAFHGAVDDGGRSERTFPGQVGADSFKVIRRHLGPDDPQVARLHRLLARPITASALRLTSSLE